MKDETNHNVDKKTPLSQYSNKLGTLFLLLLVVFAMYLAHVSSDLACEEVLQLANQQYNFIHKATSSPLSDDELIQVMTKEKDASSQALVGLDQNNQLNIKWSQGPGLTQQVRTAIREYPAQPIVEKSFSELTAIIPTEAPSDSEGAVYMVMTYPKSVFKLINQKIMNIYIFALIFSVLSFMISRYFIKDKITEPLDEIENVLTRFMDSDYKEINVAGKVGVIGQLAETVNKFQVDYQKHRQQVDANEQSLRLLLSNLNLGVVMLSSDGELVLFNPAARQLLDLGEDSYGKNYRACIKSYILVNMIDYVFQTGKTSSDEIELYLPDSRYIDVNIVPYNDSYKNQPQSVLVLLYDVTQVHKLETVRSEFVANASHELRTPVTSIKGFSETLLNGALDQPEVAENFVRIIYSESERLEKIVNDILELSRVEQKTAKVESKEFNLGKSLEELCHRYEDKAQEQKMEIITDLPDDLFYQADRHRIEQIVVNLLENALNYAGPNSQVLIQADLVDEGVRIVVADNGRGIPEYDQERIFERFYRVDKDRSRNSGGTGLGLSIVRNLVKYLGGQVKLTSQLGQGTRFEVILPN